MNELAVGVAQAPMTPPLDLWMSGYGDRDHGADHVQDELLAAACVFARDGAAPAALVTVDLCIPAIAWARRVRQAIATAVGTTADHVALCSSHTHCGPSFVGWEGEGEAEQTYAEALFPFLAGLAATATARARFLTRPARLAVAQGEAAIGINRRQRRREGGAILGQRPEGPTDHGVGVLRIDDGDGRPLALLLNATCHPVVLGSHDYGWSGDYVGVARRLLQTELGIPCLFVQGACADVNPRQRGQEGLLTTGWQLGGEALRLWAGVQPEPSATLAAAASTLSLPLSPLPDVDEARELERRAADALAQAEATPETRQGRRHLHRMLWRAARNVATRAERGERQAATEIDLQALRLGPVALACAACEPFCETGLAVKRQSPLVPTLFAGYTNGVLGYVPTADEYPFGGYEVDTAHKYFGLPAVPDPTSEQRVVQGCLELLRAVAG